MATRVTSCRGRRACRMTMLLSVVVGAVLLLPRHLRAEADEPAIDDCMDCHEDAEGEEVEFDDGSTLEVLVDRETWISSVHGRKLGCTKCHRGISDYPHPDRESPTARSYQIRQAETCKRCHYAYYTRVLDGTHYAQRAKGNQKAPTCVDCHGAHNVRNPRTPRIEIDKRCARCHQQVSARYERSVHGKALVEDNNQDVPVCTDCHQAHSMRDPRSKKFRAGSHTICARCHSDAAVMDRYGLSTNVLASFLDDFHGRSNALYAKGLGEPNQPMATCTDCHGAHDIQTFTSDGDPSSVRGRVVQVCRQCHEGVPPEFADAWLSHYEPTLASAPLVWSVKWVYRILIPVIMAGLILHVLLHLWQVRRQR